MSAKVYYVRTFGNEDNCYQAETCTYPYWQYKEVIQMLNENGTPYKAWSEVVYF